MQFQVDVETVLVLVNSWMPLKANGMSPCQLAPVPGPYPELLYREESHSREEKKLPSMERSALPGGAPKRDLHAAEMFIVNCCRQRAPRPLPPFAPPPASAPAPPSAPAPRLVVWAQKCQQHKALTFTLKVTLVARLHGGGVARAAKPLG